MVNVIYNTPSKQYSAIQRQRNVMHTLLWNIFACSFVYF